MPTTAKGNSRRLMAAFLTFALFAPSPPASSVDAVQSKPRYPVQWDVPVPAGTRLAAVKAKFDALATKLPARDSEDRSPLPKWFRAYLRASFPTLPTTGVYQYPHTASDMLRWMLLNPDFSSLSGPVLKPVLDLCAVTVAQNVNATNDFEVFNNESSIARDPSHPDYLIAASNTRNESSANPNVANGATSWQQTQFYSVNGGRCWDHDYLPLDSGRTYHSDPTVAFSSDGKAWTSTLGFRTDESATVYVQIYKSENHGAPNADGSSSWRWVRDVSAAGANDKPAMVIDTQSIDYKDNIYLAWNTLDKSTWQYGGIRFARYAKQADGSRAWSEPRLLTNRPATGAHLAVGPKGELYVAWHETDPPRRLQLVKSIDGGANFTDPATNQPVPNANGEYLATPIATSPAFQITNAAKRSVMTYLSMGVDRSPHAADPAALYVSWVGCESPAEPDGCVEGTGTRVYFNASKTGGATWLGRVIPYPNPGASNPWDQFNQWLDVDPSNGAIHLGFYDTRNGPGRTRTDVYHVVSRDGGSQWPEVTKVTALRPGDSTAQTDETGQAGQALPAVDQYGDYNGLTASGGLAFLTWTDRRDPGTADHPKHEQIFTASVPDEKPILAKYARCLLHPCGRPKGLFPGGVILNCPKFPCFVVNPLPIEPKCPPICPGRPGQPPPFIHVKLDGLGSAWDVNLLDAAGSAVPYDAARTDAGIDLRFRLDETAYKAGKLADYVLTFEFRKNGKLGADYNVKTQVEPKWAP